MGVLAQLGLTDLPPKKDLIVICFITQQESVTLMQNSQMNMEALK